MNERGRLSDDISDRIIKAQEYRDIFLSEKNREEKIIFIENVSNKQNTAAREIFKYVL